MDSSTAAIDNCHPKPFSVLFSYAQGLTWEVYPEMCLDNVLGILYGLFSKPSSFQHRVYLEYGEFAHAWLKFNSKPFRPFVFLAAS
jgi:hypothetical protein